MYLAAPLAEEAYSRSQSRSCPEWPARPQVCSNARPPGAAVGLAPYKMVAWDQDRGRRSGTSLLTNRKRSSRTLGSRQALDRPHAARFPFEGPAPPNCLYGSISVLRLNNPHSAVELLRHVCAE